ncbi:MAG TPA: NlpC/P60 family protein [Marmoricola sp.]|nr:NlpC/P60 family protein [Marmoricola sp.]
MTDGRRRISGALITLCIAALGGSMLTSAPSSAEPTIGDVRERVDHLYHEAEMASERYNDARLRLVEAKKRLGTLEADLERQEERVDTVRDQVASSVVAQYQGQALSTASEVVLSDDPEAFLSHLATIDEYNTRQGHVVAELSVAVDRLEMRETLAEREVDKIAETRAALAEEKALVDRRAAEAKELLSRLEEEREQRLSRSQSRVSASAVQTTQTTQAAPASGRAGAAVQYALAQVGDAYVYGAAGPSAFDCSGLTMMAWAAAGVALPHSSSAQMGSGAPVSTSALQPGDLVFYYSPVSHVGIYIGNGQVAHAANPSTGVRVDPVGSMPISGAVRPG